MPPPRLPAPLAGELASRSDEVARLLERDDGCAALAAAKALRDKAIAAINSGRVPPRLQEPLLGAANDLTIRISCVPPPPPADEGEQDHKGRGKGKRGGGKGRDHGGEG